MISVTEVHTCAPPPAVNLDQPDWCCPDCAQWYRVDEDHCYECGRGGPPQWVKTVAPIHGPERADGSHHLHAPPEFDLWDLMDVNVRRGGIFFGENPTPPPPEPTWLERDAQIKARYAKRIERNKAAELTVKTTYEDGRGIVAAGGWCAPNETMYDFGGDDG